MTREKPHSHPTLAGIDQESDRWDQMRPEARLLRCAESDHLRYLLHFLLVHKRGEKCQLRLGRPATLKMNTEESVNSDIEKNNQRDPVERHPVDRGAKGPPTRHAQRRAVIPTLRRRTTSLMMTMVIVETAVSALGVTVEVVNTLEVAVVKTLEVAVAVAVVGGVEVVAVAVVTEMTAILTTGVMETATANNVAGMMEKKTTSVILYAGACRQP